MCDILDYFEKKGVILPKREKSLGPARSVMSPEQEEKEEEKLPIIEPQSQPQPQQQVQKKLEIEQKLAKAVEKLTGTVNQRKILKHSKSLIDSPHKAPELMKSASTPARKKHVSKVHFDFKPGVRQMPPPSPPICFPTGPGILAHGGFPMYHHHPFGPPLPPMFDEMMKNGVMYSAKPV